MKKDFETVMYYSKQMNFLEFKEKFKELLEKTRIQNSLEKATDNYQKKLKSLVGLKLQKSALGSGSICFPLTSRHSKNPSEVGPSVFSSSRAGMMETTDDGNSEAFWLR